MLFVALQSVLGLRLTETTPSTLDADLSHRLKTVSNALVHEHLLAQTAHANL